MEANGDRTEISSIAPRDEVHQIQPQQSEYAPVVYRRYPIPHIAEVKLSRRNFLKLGAVTGGLIAAGYLGIKTFSPSGNEGKSVGTIRNLSEAVGGDFLESFRDKVCFNEESVRDWMQEEGVPSEDYGKLAAAGVSFLTVTEDAQGSSTSEGTGGVVEIKGKRYLATTMHVIDSYLNAVASGDSSKNPMLIVNVPGTKHMYRVNPASISSYTKLEDDSLDTSVFIEIEGELADEVDNLVAEQKLSPLAPMPYKPELTPELSQFRFQRGVTQMQDYQFWGKDTDANVDRYALVDTSGKAALCSGNSGAFALEKRDGRLTGNFMGVFTHSTEFALPDGTKKGFSPDSLGAMGEDSVCSVAAYMTSFGERNFATGLQEVRLR